MTTLHLSSVQIEAMKEVANIGAGHAATALSEMLNEPIHIGIPSAEILTLANLAERLSLHGHLVNAVHIQVLGEAPCRIVVLFEKAQALGFVSIFMGLTPDDESIPAPIIESTIKEVANIIGGSYLTALTELTGIVLVGSVPSFSSGTTKNAFLDLRDVPGDQEVLYVQTSLNKGGSLISGEVILIPENKSIDPLLSVFGL
jgi:chemotaxis protein CheC